MDNENTTTQGEQVQGIRSINSLYCKTGRLNGYRDAFKKGLGASRMDSTWDREQKLHTCCLSKVAWKHKVGCEVALKDTLEDKTPETMESPEKMEDDLKFSGLPESKAVKAPPIESIPEEKEEKTTRTVHGIRSDGKSVCGRSLTGKSYATENTEEITCKNCINLIK